MWGVIGFLSLIPNPDFLLPLLPKDTAVLGTAHTHNILLAVAPFT